MLEMYSCILEKSRSSINLLYDKHTSADKGRDKSKCQLVKSAKMGCQERLVHVTV